MVTKCEACENVPAEVEEHCDDRTPYRVCAVCHSRLTALALRPREWFNLAKRHGNWMFLLHDDFYDEDGTAFQPECEVEAPEEHRAPTFSEVRNDPDLLLDYTITRWHFPQNVAAAWKALDQSNVLRTIERRYATANNIDIQGTMLDVAACSLAEHGQQFVTAAWDDYREPRQLGSLAKASASCLEFNDGFSRVVATLAGMDEKVRRDSMYALSYFHRQESLDWIESNISSPVTENWGRLAAASDFNWERAISWLTTGRLLSLVALDALASIIRPQSPLLRDYGPQLKHKPNLATFLSALNEYSERDPVPRVTGIVRFLIEHSDELTIQ